MPSDSSVSLLPVPVTAYCYIPTSRTTGHACLFIASSDSFCDGRALRRPRRITPRACRAGPSKHASPLYATLRRSALRGARPASPRPQTPCCVGYDILRPRVPRYAAATCALSLALAASAWPSLAPAVAHLGSRANVGSRQGPWSENMQPPGQSQAPPKPLGRFSLGT